MRTLDVWKIAFGAWVFRTPDGRVYCYDVGRPTGHFDVWPFVAKFLGRPPDGIFLSHFHFNHIGSAWWVAARARPTPVYSSGVYSGEVRPPYDPEDHIAQNRLDDVVDRHDLSHHHLAYGDTVGPFITAVSPRSEALVGLDEDAQGRPITDDPNDDTGLSLRVTCGDYSLLLTGDIGPGITRQGMIDIASSPLAKSTVMQVPHHGDLAYLTNTEQTDHTVLDGIDPELAIIGARGGNQQPLKDYLDSRGVAWFQFGPAPHQRFRVRGYEDGTWDVSTDPGDVPPFVPMSRTSEPQFCC